MMRVNVSEYPKNLPWETKVFSMPNIPRGDIGLIEVLKEILLKVKNNITVSERLHFTGSESNITLNEACIRLRPMKMVIKTPSGWHLSSESEKWLQTEDNLYLAAVLCSRIKFVAEILYYLDSPKTAAQLQEIALSEYALNWKTTSDINSRLVWLRQLGLVNFQEFSLLYSLTETGKDFLNSIIINEPVKPDYFDETAGEEQICISDWAIEYCKFPQNRKQSIGYIIGDTKQFETTIKDYVQLIDGTVTYDHIVKFTKENYDISESSLRSFFTTLSNLHIVERKTDVLYDTTQEAKKWAENPRILDLLCMMQKHFYFIFELLQVLNDTPMTYKELAATAKVSYGFDRENVDEIRKRILIFKSAKLVQNASVDKFTVTERAKKLLDLVPVQPLALASSSSIAQPPITDDNADFFTQLRLAAKDSNNFERLERLTKIAFEKLGFQAQWLGGAGKTDVLIQASGTSDQSFSVTVDAKSTITGNVTDGLVDFDTLSEHKSKHKSDFSAIVGGSFQTERLINRSIDHGVVLFDIDTLETLIRNHSEVPIQVTLYKKVFEKPGLADITCLNEEREKVQRYGNLLHAVMDCLVAERNDPETHGILQPRDIYRSLRSSELFNSSPNVDEITSMLDFLASPLIGCIEKVKEGYCAVGTLNDAAQKFEFYARMCQPTK